MENFMTYLDETIKTLQEEEQNLISSDRKDEANFVKIKINICDICKTIYTVSAKTHDGVALKQEYIRQLTRLPENWKMSLEKAKAHNNVQKMIVEETKLEMLEIIKTKFEQESAEG